MEKSFQVASVIQRMIKRTCTGFNCRLGRIGLLVLMIGITAWPSTAWPSTEKQLASENMVDRIVAIVNNDIILLSELEKALAPYIKNIKERNLPEAAEAKIMAQARKDMLDSLVNEKLGSQKAAELGIFVDDEEVNQGIAQMKKTMLFSEDAFRSYLEETGYTLDEYKEQVKNQIIKSRLLSREIKSKTVVTQDEIEAYYKAHPDEFAVGTWYHLKHIIMLTPKTAGPEVKEAVRKKMAEIHLQITTGESFENMARQYSQSSVAENGGDLGRFNENDLADDIKEPIVNTPEGDITPVIETDFGFQIFYVQSIVNQDGNLDDDARARIHKKLYDKKLDEKFNTWMNELRDSAHIKIME